MQDSDEYESLKALNEVIHTLEKKNDFLNNEVDRLQTQLDKELTKNRDVIPQYKVSVARLKKNTQLIRDKLSDIQDIRHNEKKDYEEKVIILLVLYLLLCIN